MEGGLALATSQSLQLQMVRCARITCFWISHILVLPIATWTAAVSMVIPRRLSEARISPMGSWDCCCNLPDYILGVLFSDTSDLKI